MLKTLHWFLARELAKVSLVAFTLVMTVFVIIEPMRKQGLSSDQVVGLFGYTVPMMVTLTLPVAALFGATIVYGRFSQDNELLACRAGGIATVRLLKPALVLGLLVTAASLWLSNWVTPYLAERAEKAIKSDIRQIAYYQLRKQGYIRREGFVLHADRVDPVSDVLYGVVLVSAKMTASPSAASLTDPNAKSPYHPVVTRTSWYNIVQEDQAPIDSMPLRSPLKDDPSWYSWPQLVQTLESPAMNGGVQRSLQGLCIDIGHEMLINEVVSTVNPEFMDPNSLPAVLASRADPNFHYRGLRMRDGVADVWAPRAVRGTLEADLQSLETPGGQRVPAVVRIPDMDGVRVLEADRCRVTVKRSSWREASLVSLELEGDVRIRLEEARSPASRPASSSAPASAPAPAAAEWTERESFRVGELEMHAHIVESMARIDKNLVLTNIGSVTHDPALLRRTQEIVNREIAHLRGLILAEIHGRLAYGVSCFLMVAMGAALGLLLRGGQLLVAFAISMMPAALVIILILMGKQMLGNQRVPPSYGVTAIWGAIAALAVGDLVLYGHLARK